MSRKYYGLLIYTLVLIGMILSACGQAKNEPQNQESQQIAEDASEINEGSNQEMTYEQISLEEAKRLMADEEGYIILDARTLEEYAGGHIPGAICIPNETIGTEEPEELQDKGQLILVYCRSGNRSKQAAQKLAKLGYSNVKEFGGIIDWDGDVEK